MTGIVTAVGSFSAKVGTGAQTAVSGLSFQPQAVILWWTVAAGAGWGTDYQEGMGIVGYYNSTYTQAHIAAASKNATATSVTYQHFGGVGDATPQCIYFLQYDQTCLGAAHLTSFDAGGFTLYWDTAGAGAYLIHYMAIGGDLAGSEVLRWQQATSVAPFTQNITTGSFQPDLVFHLCPESNAAPPLTSTNAVPSIGAMDTNGNQWALSGVSTHNVSPIRTGRTFSNSACIVRTWPYNVIDTLATNNGMLANGFSVRFTTTTGLAIYYYSLCLKGTVAGELEVGSFTKPTVIGAQTQTVSTSKVGLVNGVLFGSGSTATNGSAVAGHRFSFGGSDGTHHHMLCVTDKDNSNPTVTYKNNATTIAVQIDDNDTETDEGVGTATLGGANNFQIVWSANTTTTATLIGYIAFGVTAHLDIVSAETATLTAAESLAIALATTSAEVATLTAYETSVPVIGTLSIIVGGTNISGIVAPSTVGVVDQLDGRNTCQFTTRSNTNSFKGEIGNPIQVWAVPPGGGAAGIIFAGIITDVRGMQLGDPNPVSGWDYAYKCADYSTYASRHVVAWNYENMSADDIVLHLNQYFMAGEGITAVKVADGGYVQPGVILKKAVFNYIPVSQALDQLATQCGYSWYIDYDKNLRFFDRATYTAPYSLTDVKYNYISLVTEKTQQDYRNRQWIQGGHQISNPRTEKFVGDGKATSFTLQYTVAKTPTITVDGVTQTVGVESVDTNKAWYWSDSSNTINQAREFTPYEDYCTVKYDFAEDTDTTLTNTSPNAIGCDAVAYENNYQAVSSGAGYWRFTDTHDYIKIPHQISIDNVTAHTMEWIIYIGSFQPTARLWDKTKHIVYIDDANKNLVIKRYDTGGVKYAQFSTPANTFVAGKVYHIQLEWNCTVVNSTPIVKVNDHSQILTASGSGTVTAWAADSSYDAYIGNDSGSTHYFDGGFHLFRLWRTSALVPSLPTVATGLLTDDQFHVNYLAEMWRYSPDTGMGHPLTSKQTLKVTYQYGFPIIDYVENTTEQTAQAVKEGEGTGIYEAIYNDGATTDVAWAAQEAEALLSKYMVIPETITFYTFEDGLGAGQLITINLPELSINSTYLIESVTINDVDFVIYNYEVVALSGQSHTWSDYFKDMTKAGQKFEIGGGDTLILASVNDLATTTAVTCTEAHGTPAHLTTTDATVGFSECLT